MHKRNRTTILERIPPQKALGLPSTSVPGSYWLASVRKPRKRIQNWFGGVFEKFGDPVTIQQKPHALYRHSNLPSIEGVEFCLWKRPNARARASLLIHNKIRNANTRKQIVGKKKTTIIIESSHSMAQTKAQLSPRLFVLFTRITGFEKGSTYRGHCCDDCHTIQTPLCQPS